MSQRATDCYVVYGTGPWDAPWLMEHNLAHALGRRHRVLYIEPPLTPLGPVRYGLRRESLEQARALLRRRPREHDGIQVFRPLALPPLEHPRARAASVPMLRAQVAGAARRAGMSRPVVIAARSMLDLAGAAGERLCLFLVKDAIDAGSALIGKDAASLAAAEEAMCRHADLVCTVSQSLRERVTARGHAATLLTHGFHADLADRYDGASEPADLAGLSRPRLGYAGRIDGRLDFTLLEELADRFGHGSIVLVGPISPRLDTRLLSPLRGRPNVHFLGVKGRAELPAYLSHLDCSLMPYRRDEWGRHGSPLKVWDYLYAGPPVVGTGYVALREFPAPLVEYAEGADDFAARVLSALEEPAGAAATRRAHARANTWEARAAQIADIVAALETPERLAA